MQKKLELRGGGKVAANFWHRLGISGLVLLGLIILIIIIVSVWSANDYPKYGLYDWGQVDVVIGQENQLANSRPGETAFTIHIQPSQSIINYGGKPDGSENPDKNYQLTVSGDQTNIVLAKANTGGKRSFLDIDSFVFDPRKLSEKISNLDLVKGNIVIHENDKTATLEASADKDYIYLKTVSDPANLVHISSDKVKRIDRGILVSSSQSFKFKKEPDTLRGISADFFLGDGSQNIFLPADLVEQLKQKEKDSNFEFDYTFGADARSIQDILKAVQGEMVNPQDIKYITATEYFMDGHSNKIDGAGQTNN